MSEVDPGVRRASLQECEDCLEPAKAFSIVGNDTRLAILEALWNAPDRPISFSSLRDRVGIRDSAQFNYHLGELRGQFIEKTDDGYDFRAPGRKVVTAILAGSFTEHPELDPFEVEGTCARCGGTLFASYADEKLTIECAQCGHGHGAYSFPPGGFHNRNKEEIVQAFGERVRHLHCLAADGVCPECNGRVETDIRDNPDCCLGVDVQVHLECQQCHHELCSAVGLVLLDHADVVQFYSDHGIELSSRPYWTLPWCVTDDYTSVLSRDPWRIEVVIPIDGEELAVTLDQELQVVSTDRQRGS